MRSMKARKMPDTKHAWKRPLLPLRQQLEEKGALSLPSTSVNYFSTSFVVHFIKGIYQLCPTTNGRNRLGRKNSKVAKNWFDIRSEEAR